MTVNSYCIGWYQVAWSREVPVNVIKSVQLCNQKLVLFRDSAGKINTLDAYCPHLGAHLGIGGKICGDNIQCPFHGWSFNGKGECTKIPYSSKIPSRAKIRRWKTNESDGIIFVYFDPFDKISEIAAGTPLPKSSSIKWSRSTQKFYQIRTHHSDILENAFDCMHFKIVHSIPMQIKCIRTKSGKLLVCHLSKTRKFGIAFRSVMKMLFLSPGVQIVSIKAAFIGECQVIATVTPHDVAFTNVRFSIRVPKSSLLPWDIIRRFIFSKIIHMKFSEDLPIWNHKIHREYPLLAKGEKSIAQFRKWYATFPKDMEHTI